MSKYSFEFKLKLVLEYLSGESSGHRYISKKYNLSSNSLLELWVNQYKQFGEEGLIFHKYASLDLII